MLTSKKKNGELLLNVAKEHKSFGKFFTANGGGPVSFIRSELRLETAVGPHDHKLE